MAVNNPFEIDFSAFEIQQRRPDAIANGVEDIEPTDANGVRAAIFHNHCKVIVGFGDKFDFAIESSTNLNVNLRLEQTTIFTDRELELWYKDYFDEIHAFNRDFDDWVPWGGTS